MFFPSEPNVLKLVDYIKRAKRTLKICVFNFTNNELAAAVLDRHKNGVDVQIITDDECIKNKGSDVNYLVNNGVQARTDASERNHMHNKFAVVDGIFLITGSFNWTGQAGSSNQENILVVDNPYYLEKYTAEFNKLWIEFSDQEVEKQEHKAAVSIQKAYRGKKNYQNKNKW